MSSAVSRRRTSDRQPLRARALPFLLVSLLGILLTLIPTGGEQTWLLLGTALADLCAVAALAAFLPWRRFPRWASLPLVVMSLAGVALVLLGDGHPAWDLIPLILLPVVWNASYGDFPGTVVAAATGVGVIILTGTLDGVSSELIIRTSALWAGILILAGAGVHRLVAGLRASLASREEAIRQTATLGLAADELHSAVGVDGVMSIAVTAAAHLIPAASDRTRRAHLAYAVDGTIRMLAEFADDGEPTFGAEPMEISSQEAFESLTGPVKPVGIPVGELPVGSKIREVLVADRVGFLAWIPLRLDETGRTLLMVPSQDRPFDAGQLERLGTLGSIVQLALRNALAREQLEQMAATDSLTGLTNRREWIRRLGSIPRATRYAIVMADIDQLNSVNGSLGQEAGDRVLKNVAKALTKTVRREDVVARVGGDAFATLLVAVMPVDAANVANRMIKNLEKTDDDVLPRVSMGVAAGEPDSDPAAIVAAAEAALQASKQAGGGSVHVAEQPQAATPAAAPAHTEKQLQTRRRDPVATR
jgi:diguanylate cyclase (GGDEF)-like protein